MTFRQAAMDAGFSMKQLEFFEEYVAKVGHQHIAEDITGLEETVAELVEDNLGEEEGEEG